MGQYIGQNISTCQYVCIWEERKLGLSQKVSIEHWLNWKSFQFVKIRGEGSVEHGHFCESAKIIIKKNKLSNENIGYDDFLKLE